MVERNCPVCNKKYDANPGRLKFGRETTCSRACSYAYRAERLVKSESLTCSTCGRQFNRPPSHKKAKHGSEFCSPGCHYQGRKNGLSKRVVNKPYKISEEARSAWREGAKRTRLTRLARGNYAHSEKTKKLMSEITTRAIAEGKISRVSKLEDRVADYLQSKEVSFVRQYGIRDPMTGRFLATLDFFVGNQIAVEVNGTFWHADPRFYDLGSLKPAQIRSLERWATKLDILEVLQIPLLVVWEHDLKQDFEGTLDSMISAVGQAEKT